MKREDVLDADGGRVCERQQTSRVSLEDDPGVSGGRPWCLWRTTSMKRATMGSRDRWPGRGRQKTRLRKAVDRSTDDRRVLLPREHPRPPETEDASAGDRRRAHRGQKTRSSRTEDWATDAGWGDHDANVVSTRASFSPSLGPNPTYYPTQQWANTTGPVSLGSDGANDMAVIAANKERSRPYSACGGSRRRSRTFRRRS
jgi:hypothetical protein